jgi:hypothetical protein
MGPLQILVRLGQITPEHAEVGMPHQPLQGVDIHPIA